MKDVTSFKSFFILIAITPPAFPAHLFSKFEFVMETRSSHIPSVHNIALFPVLDIIAKLQLSIKIILVFFILKIGQLRSSPAVRSPYNIPFVLISISKFFTTNSVRFFALSWNWKNP